MAEFYLGLISGTSADGIDAALVRFAPSIEVVASSVTPYPGDLRERLLALTAPNAAIPLDLLGALDVEVGECFAAAALELLDRSGIAASNVRAIGSHGQTIRHRPLGAYPFSMQIGDASVIAERTGICTVADFRRADVAAGGQGAPLAPALHAAIFKQFAPCAVLNLGGIANLSLISGDGHVLGFDTGPANCLLDAWHARHHGSACDRNGAWASSGTLNQPLLEAFVQDPYFTLEPPKSSGREYFNLAWVDGYLAGRDIDASNVQRTLLALSARTIVDALHRHAPDTCQIFACGGGVHNTALMQALKAALAPAKFASTTAIGVDPDYVEAALLAWLAQERLAGRPGNLPSVTGARGPRLLGAIHDAAC